MHSHKHLISASSNYTRRRRVQPCRSQQQQQRGASAGSSSSGGSGSSEDPTYSYSDPVNRFLGQFLPSAKAASSELSVDFNQPKLKGLSPQQMAQLVEEGLGRTQWFVTGEVDPRLFSDYFYFKDESVATRGIRAYAVGVRKLFDQSCSKVELVTVTARPDARQIVITWRLEGGVNLPLLKGRIKPYVVTTTFELDQDGLICSQLDEFSVPGWDLLLSFVFGTGFGAAPAPAVEELRKAAAAAGQVPVAGSSGGER